MKTLLILAGSLVFLTSCMSKGTKNESQGPLSGSSSVGPNYKYNELMIKDYDEMLEMVMNFVNKAKDAAGEDGESNEDLTISHLRNGLKLILSRPDSDNMVAKLVPEVRRMMLGFNAYEPSVSLIADEAIDYIQSDNAAPSIQSTSLFILDNILGEIRPEAEANKQLRQVVIRIRDAGVSVSKEVQRERKIRGMFSTKSPSDTARDIINKIEGKNKKKK